jgi:hypothetical protein
MEELVTYVKNTLFLALILAIVFYFLKSFSLKIFICQFCKKRTLKNYKECYNSTSTIKKLMLWYSSCMVVSIVARKKNDKTLDSVLNKMFAILFKNCFRKSIKFSDIDKMLNNELFLELLRSSDK